MKKHFLANLTINELRESYKEYLKTLDIKESTVSTYVSDSFHLYRHDSSVDFLNLLQDENFEEIAFEKLEFIIPKIFTGNPKNIDENIRFFFVNIKRLKKYIDFMNKKYN